MAEDPDLSALDAERETARPWSPARIAAVAAGLAAMALIDAWNTIVQIRDPQSLYLSITQPNSNLEIATLLNLLLLSTVTGVLIWLLVARRENAQRPGIYLPVVLTGATAIWLFEEFIVSTFILPMVFKATDGRTYARTALVTTYAILFLIPLCVTTPMLFIRPKKAWAAVKAIALVLSPLAVLCAGQTVWQVAFPLRITGPAQIDARLAPGGPPRPLVLWVIFDELDERATFEHSLGRLKLPNFAALSQVAFRARHACETGDFTAKAIPSYTLGKVVKNVRWDSANELMLRIDGEQTFVPWTKQNTIFHDARALGRHTAIVGYYHPYCRLFQGVVDACSTSPCAEAGALMKWWALLQAVPLPRAMALQLERTLPSLRTVKRFDGAQFDAWKLTMARYVRQDHLEAEQNLREKLMSTLQDTRIDFVFTHLPVPHPPTLVSIAVADAGSAGNPGYAHDIQAADSILGTIRSTLEAQNRWDEATVIVTSDHTVRPLWKDYLALSPTLLQAITTMRDRTIPFLVKLPHQKRPLTFDKPFNSVAIHDVVQAVMRGEIHQPEDIPGYLKVSNGCPAN